jgi:hypothetical protein
MVCVFPSWITIAWRGGKDPLFASGEPRSILALRLFSFYFPDKMQTLNVYIGIKYHTESTQTGVA